MIQSKNTASHDPYSRFNILLWAAFFNSFACPTPTVQYWLWFFKSLLKSNSLRLTGEEVGSGTSNTHFSLESIKPEGSTSFHCKKKIIVMLRWLKVKVLLWMTTYQSFCIFCCWIRSKHSLYHKLVFCLLLGIVFKWLKHNWKYKNTAMIKLMNYL